MKRIVVKIILVLSYICLLIVAPTLFYFEYENTSYTIILLVILINILILITNNIRVRYFLMKGKKSLIYADVRNSRLIKLYYGKDISKKILNKVHDIIESHIRNYGYVYKIDNDHFIILVNFYNKNELISLVNKINEEARKLLDELYISFGINICDNNGYESNENKASLACNFAKNKTMEIYSFYDSEDIEDKLKEKNILDDLIESLKNHEFEVYYQPIYNYKSKNIVGSEAIIRLIHNNAMDIAIKYNFNLLLDKYILEEVCKNINELKKDNIIFNTIFVNISKYSLCDDKMIDYYSNILKKYNINKNEIEFEITESDNNLLNKRVHELSKKFNISLDNFGVGNSSLEMLNEDNINTIKIDKKFIIDESDKGRKLLNNIIKLIKDLGFNIVVNGVETESQYLYLKSKGCNVIQGNYYSKPLSFKEYKKLLEKGNKK